MPYYKSKKGKDVLITIGKNKREVRISTTPQFYQEENLDVLFPDHIERVETLEEFVRKEAIRQNPQPFKEIFLKDSLPTGSWKGERCFIIGGGMSLQNFDFSKLEGERIIAINKSFVDVPFADMVFAVDRQFQDWILKGAVNMEQAQKLWPDFKGYKVWLKIPGEIYQNGIEFVKSAGHEGISTSLEEGLYDGSNSGYAAINLAIALGANPIYLLGYDMKHDKEGGSHYHGGYPKKQTEPQLQIYAKKFPRLAQLAKDKGIKIINLNKDSALSCFEFGTIEEALSPMPPREHDYVIVSFYTPEYVQDISRLIQSVEQFKLPYDFELLKNLPLEGANKYKNWSKNAYLKATFIKKMMQKHQGKNIIWIDADAVIQKNPLLFDKMPDCDIAVHYRDNVELLTGTLYIRNNDTMKKIVDEWIETNETSKNFLEQKNLENVLDKNKEVKIFNFPASYCQIFDIMSNTGRPVIEHFQSSRKWRKNTNTMKKISIIMPTYNQDKFIEESIDSILNQTFENWELIIVNDGSTDNTKQILDKQNDPRIRIIHKENEGTGSALNMGFALTTGEYETWLASDNKYYPNALQDMFDILETKKDVDFVYCNCEIGVMDSTGLGEITRKNYNSEVPMEWNAHNFYEHYNIGVIWLWRKELRISAGKDFIIEPCEDYEMTTRMIEAGGRFYYHPIVSGWHRRHNENLTKKLTTSGNYIPTLMERMKKKRNRLSNTEEIFTKIYQHNKWRGAESKSGKGSDSIQTSELISALPAFFKKWNIKTIIDAACGDWNWMSKIIPTIEFDKYTGIDIVGDLIQNNNKNFTNDKIQFKQKNIILYPLEEKADVIISRDTLNHFSDKDALNALDHFIHSGTTYLLITNFGKHRENADIMTGNWRPICFENAPFNFPEPLDRIVENCTEKDSSGSYEDKHLALWKLEDIYSCIRKSQQIPDYKENVIFNLLTDAIHKQLESASNPPSEKKDNSNWHLVKIPKRAYFYWGGNMPYFRYLTPYSFCKLNPDWEVVLYYPKQTTKTNTWISTEHCYDLDCPDYFEELKKLPITLKEFDGKDLGIPNEYPEVWKSDFLRWHLLGQNGGVWLDMDILFNKPMNFLDLNNPQNKDLDTIVSISEIFAPATFHSIGFMASAPKNDYYRYVMSKAIRTKPDFTNYQANGVVLLNTEFPTLEHIRKKFPNIKVDSISFNTVYAYYPMQFIKEIFTPFAPNRLKSHSLGIHWYAGHPSAGEFTNKLTPDNYLDFIDTPIGKILYEVLSK